MKTSVLAAVGAVLLLSIALAPLAAKEGILHQRVDIYGPNSGAFKGAEQEWYDTDGKRLRWEITDAEGNPTLVFFVTHDDEGREAQALFYEEGAESPSREVFTYDGMTQTTTYYYEPGVPADRTETDYAGGREVRKRFYNKEGTMYGDEEVFWDVDPMELRDPDDPPVNQLGWTFRYTKSGKETTFRYQYQEFNEKKRWTRRLKTRNGIPEQVEVRTLATIANPRPRPTPFVFASGVISSEVYETSPSFSKDGKTMVFARYGDDWSVKEPFIATLGENGWEVSKVKGIGNVYNLAISPDANTIIFSKRSDEDVRTTYRIGRKGNRWSKPEDLTKKYGVVGTYPCLDDNGDLFYTDSDGPAGDGIYSIRKQGDGFGGEPVAIFNPKEAPPFDAFTADGKLFFMTRCFDDTCASGPPNGVFEVYVNSLNERISWVRALPYAWGAQPVEPLGLFLFTDGEDVLAIPLESAGIVGVLPKTDVEVISPKRLR